MDITQYKDLKEDPNAKEVLSRVLLLIALIVLIIGIMVALIAWDNPKKLTVLPLFMVPVGGLCFAVHLIVVGLVLNSEKFYEGNGRNRYQKK
jgi:O-antigen/teichoic acid export membrane protein